MSYAIQHVFMLQALKAHYFKLNEADTKRIESILLASSAIPYIFDSVEIDGEMYWDGGAPFPNADNVPIRPIYEAGCDLIIVVHLNRSSLVVHNLFPNARIVEIVPLEDQGGFWKGTLDFSSKSAARRIQQGYDDTVRRLKPIFDMAIVQNKISDQLQEIVSGEIEFHKLRNTLLNEREQILQDLQQYIKK